ncbi:preprotein translocase subunit SecE [Candidatus Palibaumannia cicadellinicola]|uniref:Protein translocase subunit SecE n=1 Tax=Candidatus Palibaumannia cicadellinicola TaxID=186490 RepID=A0A0K2BLX0_9GAMM|nr:preprotein translocase subunit SecE [Candidatus Baumannia cicadellinicola]AKZ66028.1 Preprotein translocase subunit SecE [Candidatus Baumannia cicadellinicola]
MNHTKEKLNKEKQRYKEIIKWFIVLLLFMIAIFSNYFFSVILRTILLFIITIIAGGVIMITEPGRLILAFLQDSRTEVRKVIWPSYQETLYTTLIVIVLTFIISIVIWIIDSLIINILTMITKLRF